MGTVKRFEIWERKNKWLLILNTRGKKANDNPQVCTINQVMPASYLFTSQSIVVKIWSLQLLIRFLFLRISFNYPTEYRVALNTTPQPLLTEMTELLTKLLRRKKTFSFTKTNTCRLLMNILLYTTVSLCA